jgi:uncharacterized membrane protein YidH (DUF202 family)
MAMTIKKIIVMVSSIFAPYVMYAQTNTLRNVVSDIVAFLSGSILPLLFLIALTWFIWGTIQFIRNSDNQEKRKEGRKRMLWGIIALFVMVSYLGITAIFTETFFNRGPILPQLYEEVN